MERNYAKYILKKTKHDYNLISEDFSRARSRIWEEMRFLVDDYVIAGEKILDLGCGNGRLFEVLQNKKVDYIGVDNSEKLIEIAKKKFPKARFQTADTLNLPFPNNFFDKIYSIAVLHHIPSKEFRLQFLREAKRVLKPEGFLILTVWDLWQKSSFRKEIYKSILSKIVGKSKLDFYDILIPWMGMENCYFHCFKKKEFKNLIKKVNFKIKESGIIIVPLKKRKHFNFYAIAKR